MPIGVPTFSSRGEAGPRNWGVTELNAWSGSWLVWSFTDRNLPLYTLLHLASGLFCGRRFIVLGEFIEEADSSRGFLFFSGRGTPETVGVQQFEAQKTLMATPVLLRECRIGETEFGLHRYASFCVSGGYSPAVHRLMTRSLLIQNSYARMSSILAVPWVKMSLMSDI